MNLEGLIGADPDRGDIHLEILVPMASLVLRNQSAEIEELRFAFLNALTLLDDWEVPESVYDHIDENLEHFMLTCRCVDLSDVMFADLLVDHYRCDRALRLIRRCFLDCRVSSRVDTLLSMIEFGLAVNDCVKAGLPEIANELLNDLRPSRRRIGKRLAKAGLGQVQS